MKLTEYFGKKAGWKAGLGVLVFMLSMNVMLATVFAEKKEVPVPDDITPVTWEVSEDHLMIDTEEARKLYDRMAADDYPTLEELKNDPVVNNRAVP